MFYDLGFCFFSETTIIWHVLSLHVIIVILLLLLLILVYWIVVRDYDLWGFFLQLIKVFLCPKIEKIV